MAALGPCDDHPNHPTVAFCNGTRRNCVDGGHGGVPFSVCDACATDTIASAAIQGTVARITQLAKPPTPAATVTAQVRGFRTLLCEACIKREQDLREARDYGDAPPEYSISWANRRFMSQYARNTCKCRLELLRQDRPRHRSHRHCLVHRLQLCNDIDNERQTNETWLEHTARDNAWNTIGARVSRRNRRLREGTYRACRCGSDVEAKYGSPPGLPNGPNSAPAAVLPGVQQCMRCSGICHALVIPPPARMFNPRKHNHDFRIGRPRSARLG